MKEGNYLAVWLFEKAARAFLGLAGDETGTRWCALGVMRESHHVGVWLDIDVVQERTRGDNKVVQSWTVKPKSCFIRWDFIMHMQVWGTPVPEKKEIGFFPSPK